MRILSVMAALMLAAGVAHALAAPRDAVMGTWLTEDGTSKIRFENCGGQMCGRIVWLKYPNDLETGKPPVDKNNPDPALRKRPLLGLVIFSDFKPESETEWHAVAYNAQDSNTYDVTLRMKPDGTLELEGCGLMGLICLGQTWTRAEN